MKASTAKSPLELADLITDEQGIGALKEDEAGVKAS
jgi:hypothetical protein